MRYTDLFESENVLLYRGDNAHVDHFSFDKTDDFALFGRGIYLTDNKTIATDYTKKGGEPIFPRKERDAKTFKSKSQLIRSYVIDLIYNELDFRKVAQKIRGDIQDQFYASDKNEKLPEDYWKNLLKQETKKEFAEYLKKAISIWKQRKKGFVIFKDTLGNISFHRKDNNASISVFSFPQSYIDKTLDGEAPLGDRELNVMRQILIDVNDKQGKEDFSERVWDLRSNKSERSERPYLTFDNFVNDFKLHGARYAWSDDTHGASGQNPSFDFLFNGTHSGQIWRDHFGEMLSKFKQLGYVGFNYKGGERMGEHIRGGGGIKHKAYSFWDADYVNSVRLDSEADTSGTRISTLGNNLDVDDFAYIFQNM